MTKNIAAWIDEIAEKWKVTVVPFLSNINNSKSIFIFGTGFIVEFDKSHYLVTALHVLTDAKEYENVVIKINETSVLFENLVFYCDKENDIAITNIANLIEKNNIESIFPIQLNKDYSLYSSLDTYLFMGYPSSKNELQPKYNKYDKNIYSFTTHLLDKVPKISTSIMAPIYFKFDIRKFINSELKKSGRAPIPRGMSGGPVFELMQRTNNENIIGSPRLKGILVEWHKDAGIIVATSYTKLLDLLREEKNRII